MGFPTLAAEGRTTSCMAVKDDGTFEAEPASVQRHLNRPGFILFEELMKREEWWRF